jgi:hypothetical protein
MAIRPRGTVPEGEACMSMKAVIPWALWLTAVGWCAARGDDNPQPYGPSEMVPAPRMVPGTGSPSPTTPGYPTAPTGEGLAPATPEPAQAYGLSSWITYHHADCCGPIGGSGPIYSELFVRTGPVFPVAGGVLRDLVQPGWQIEGGGRSQFYDTPLDAAWAVELSLSHSYNHSRGDRTVPIAITFDFPLPAALAAIPGLTAPASVNVVAPFVVRDLQRTNVSGSVGREWYLVGPADAPGVRWRAGIDLGGRLGTSRVDIINELPGSSVPSRTVLGTTIVGVQRQPTGHLTDTIYGPFGAIYTDVEVPGCGCCTFLGGLRVEGDYFSQDILKGMNNSNLADVNLLVTFGVKF